MTKAELYLAYDHKRAALEADKRRIEEGQEAPENFQEMVDAVQAAYEAWNGAPD